MNVFIYSTHILWPTHYETELEIIENHIAQKDKIFHFTCYGHFKSCDANMDHQLYSCMLCADITNCGRKLLSEKTRSYKIINYPKNKKQELDKFISNLNYSSIKDLQKINYKNFDVGFAVSSSLISRYRDSNLDLSQHAEEVFNLLFSNLELYESVLNYIKKYRPARVYAFNGRVSHGKAILRACQFDGVDCYIHERGANITKFNLWLNTTPHDISYMVNLINKQWANADPSNRELVASQFYKERVKGLDQGWFSFTKHQERRLPDNWNSKKKNIIIFNSSEDEFASIGPEWQNVLYADQLTGIKRILFDLKDEENIIVYLRIHPNLKDVNDESTSALYNLKYDNLEIIPANSTVGSYELLFNANCVVTFGSSVGIEAVYWGIPSITLGKCYYAAMNATYQPKSHEEAIALLKSDLLPNDKKAALKYGYFFKTHGIEYKFYKPEGIKHGAFKSVNVWNAQSSVRTLYLKWAFRRRLRPLFKFLEKYYAGKKSKLLYLRK